MNIKRTDINTAKLKLYEGSKKENVKNYGEKLKGSTANKTESNDKITISSEAKGLDALDFATAKVKADLFTYNKELSDMNLAKLGALKEQIRNGDYAVSTEELAMSILSGGNV